MNGRTATGRQRLAEAIEKAHESVQEAYERLYAVELAVERAENDDLAAIQGGATGSVDQYPRMRTEISELRPLLVPISRWLTSARRGVGTHGA